MDSYEIWKIHISEKLYIFFLLLLNGEIFLICGFGFDIGKIILKIIYPSIPEDYKGLPLIDGPNIMKKYEDSQISNSSYKDDETHNFIFEK